jgi:hypothetical protein
MTLRRYPGYTPMNVAKDAKYSVSAIGEVRLEYQESARVRFLLSTDGHPGLVEMVNAVKKDLTGQPGGAFYINEFKAVLVPDGQGGRCYWAGEYHETLEFRDKELFVSPVAPGDLEPGDAWPGPRVGIKYVLVAGGADIRYELVDGRRREIVLLSDDVGASAAARTARLVAETKGSAGGPFYVNECRELFAPVGGNGSYSYLYVGNLEGLAWFDAPAAWNSNFQT